MDTMVRPLYNATLFALLFVSRYSGYARGDEIARVEQENLDVKCLQLLRAVIHNEIVKLPDNWEDNPVKHKRSTFKAGSLLYDRLAEIKPLSSSELVFLL